ncbi:hypothetical protein MTP99_018667 [Tenebrio molitor]|nr:hypothetical protein MTP99_018667 [Tenebrio molitor]
MQNFQQDCNGGGWGCHEKLHCDDFLIIHNIGGWACQGEKLPTPTRGLNRNDRKIVPEILIPQLYLQCKARLGVDES